MERITTFGLVTTLLAMTVAAAAVVTFLTE